MIERLSNVIFFALYTISAFCFFGGILSFDGEGLFLSFIVAPFVFGLGWSIRYILTGKKEVWWPRKVIHLVKANSIAYRIKNGVLALISKIRKIDYKAKMKSFISTAIILTVALAASVVAREVSKEFFSKASTRDIESFFLKEENANSMMKTFKLYFPRDYNNFLELMKDKINSDATDKDVRVAAFTFMRSFTQEHLKKAAQAPSKYLMPIVDSQRDLLLTLQKESIKNCADFGMRGFSAHANLSDRAKQLTTKTVEAQFIAIHHGEVSPTKYPEISEEAATLWITKMMEYGAPEDLINTVFIEENMQNLTIEEECLFSVTMMQAIDSLPENMQSNIFSSILAEM